MAIYMHAREYACKAALLDKGMERLHATFPEASVDEVCAAVQSGGEHLGLGRLKLQQRFRPQVKDCHQQLVVGTRVEHTYRGLGYVVRVNRPHNVKWCKSCNRGSKKRDRGACKVCNGTNWTTEPPASHRVRSAKWCRKCRRGTKKGGRPCCKECGSTEFSI